MGGKILWDFPPLPCRFSGIKFRSLPLGQKLFYLLSSCNKGSKCEIIWILCLFGISSRSMRKILPADNSWPRILIKNLDLWKYQLCLNTGIAKGFMKKTNYIFVWWRSISLFRKLIKKQFILKLSFVSKFIYYLKRLF